MSEIIAETEMRVIPALISFVLLILFIAPFFAGIVNLGNCTGTVISAVMLGMFVFYGAFSEFMCTLWLRPVGKLLICFFSVILFLCASSAALISGFMIKASGDAPKSADTTLIVLGCRVRGDRPSLMLKRRLDAAYKYLRENESVRVIVSGGKGTDEQISEAQCMKEYLTAKGISSERIYMEDKSKSTYENLKFSKEIIIENALCEKITIVTDGYHQLRAEMIADKLGIKANNISANTSLWLVPTYSVREWFAVAYQFIFG